MPILKPEPNLYPCDVLEQQDQSRTWWAMYTLSRQEKSLMRHLRTNSISYYCPITANRYRSPSGRERVTYLPLFSNYVFVRGTEIDRYTAVTSGCISRQVVVPDPEKFLEQLRAIQKLIASNHSVTIESKLVPGDRVRIKSGPFMGIVGTILYRQGECRLLVTVDFMQQGVSVSISDWETEKVA